MIRKTVFMFFIIGVVGMVSSMGGQGITFRDAEIVLTHSHHLKSYLEIAVTDWNNDQKKDILIATRQDHGISYFWNIGSNNDPQFKDFKYIGVPFG